MAAAVLVVAVFVIRVWTGGPEQSEAVGDAPNHDGWQTITYLGVRVDVPDDWERKDTEGCPYAVERWGPTDSSMCGEDGGIGVSLLPSGNFDAFVEPGEIRQYTEGDVRQWSGYVLVQPLAVSADGSRELVQDVLASARATKSR